jgi:transmembrane sensor
VAELIRALSRYGLLLFDSAVFADEVHSYSTAPSGRRVIALSGGSHVTLGARTELPTRFTASRRVVVLNRGEAWFNVAHDSQRPFLILAGSGAVTAVGSKFDVRRELDTNLDEVVVTVDTGVVEVGPLDEANPKDAVGPNDSGGSSGVPPHPLESSDSQSEPLQRKAENIAAAMEVDQSCV